MYATYSRVRGPARRLAGHGRALLEAGADPNDGRFFRGLPTPFTALTGALGGGEGDQPPHQHAIPLARAAARRRRGPQRRAGAVQPHVRRRRRLPRAAVRVRAGHRRRRAVAAACCPTCCPPPTVLRPRAAGLGGDARPTRAGRAAGPPRRRHRQPHRRRPRRTDAQGRTPIELRTAQRPPRARRPAARARRRRAALAPVDAFVAAALAGDAAAVAATPPDVVAAARRARPGLVVWAAAQGRVEAVELLVAAGFDVNAFGAQRRARSSRSGRPRCTPRSRTATPLLARSLLALGRRPDVGATPASTAPPLDWAGYFDRPEIAALLTG